MSMKHRGSREPALPFPKHWFRPGTALALALLAVALCGCNDEDRDFSIEDIESGLETARPGPTVITEIEEEAKPVVEKSRRLKGTLVKEAERIGSPEFRRNYIKGSYHDAALGQQAVLEIITFVGPARDESPPRLMPMDIREIREEALHMVQRAPPQGRIRILKDMEIFLVFKKAYEGLTHEDRLDLVNRWKERYGSKEPEASDQPFHPLFWLRENPVLWERGGRFWWWAAHALMQEEGFGILEDGRVHITLPGGKGMFHS